MRLLLHQLKWCEDQDLSEKEHLKTNPKTILCMGVLFPGTVMSLSVLDYLCNK